LLAKWIASLTREPNSFEAIFNGQGQFTPAMVRDLLYPAPLDDEGKTEAIKPFLGITPEEAKARGIDLSPLEQPPAATRHTPTLAKCFEEFKTFKANNREATLSKYVYMRRALELYGGKLLLAKPIGQITVVDLVNVLAAFPVSKKPQYFNTYTLVLNQVFEMARINGYINENPFSKLPKTVKRRKVVTEPDHVPTIKQCESIVANMRIQKASDTRDDSADLCEFIHLAALGQAEAAALLWKDVDLKRGVLKVKRIKTDVYFEIAMHDALRRFLKKLAAKSPNRNPSDKLFRVRSMKKALHNACTRLGFPAYSPRDLRKARIVWCLRKGVPIEIIAKWQGHSDNGVLIRRTYANVIDEGARHYEVEQLAKLK
jgi:integrase